MITDQTLAIGVDLGATKIAAALVSRDGRVLASRQTLSLVAEGPAAVCGRIAVEVRALQAQTTGRVVGVGIGSPGLVDSANGIVKGAINMGWTEVHLAEEVSGRCGGLLVCVENDACAAAVGEGYFGSALESKDYFLLTVGSGLGSGVICGGKLVTGAHSVGTDMGHYVLDPDHGRLCVCGHRGCAETVCSGPGLVATAKALIAEGRGPTNLSGVTELTSGIILDAAKAGDPLALVAVRTMGKWIGHVAAAVGSVIDPDVVVIGGGLGIAAFGLMMGEMEGEYRRRVPLCIPMPDFRVSTLASSALGSASLVWSRLGE